MSKETIIILPDAKTMLTRLQEVNSELDCIRRFYPILTKHARKAYEPTEIFTLLELALNEFTGDMSRRRAWSFYKSTSFESYLEALVPDKAAAAIVKDVWARHKAQWAEMQDQTMARIIEMTTNKPPTTQ